MEIAISSDLSKRFPFNYLLFTNIFKILRINRICLAALKYNPFICDVLY